MQRRPAACLCLILGCGTQGGEPAEPSTPVPPVVFLAVAPETATVAPGRWLQLTAVGRDQTGAPVPGVQALWSSDDPLRAGVSGGGVVSAVGLGSVRIWASYRHLRTFATVSVADSRFRAAWAGGNHSCGITPDNLARCWGLNQFGQIGNRRSGGGELSPVPVAGNVIWSLLALGGLHSCGLSAGGVTYCWGWNASGQLGRGTTGSDSVPAPVDVGTALVALTAGGQHSCGLTAPGSAVCWGRNFEGQVGDGTTTMRTIPTPVAGSVAFASLTAGGRHTCGLTADGTAYCWGYNALGQLGDGSTQNRTAPVTVAGGLQFSGLSAGRFHTCGIAADGAAYCWGSNLTAQIGNGRSGEWDSLPSRVIGVPALRAIAAAGQHTCALATDDRVLCWGQNVWGQLGDGSLATRAAADTVAGGLRLAALSAGGEHTCGMTRAGLAYCWGLNVDGELGIGPSNFHPVPLPVTGQR